MILGAVVDLFRPRAALEAEMLVLRQQIVVLRRGRPGRQDCLDRIVVTGEQHLRHILQCDLECYNAVRTHLSLGKDAPMRRIVQCVGRIEGRPVLGELHQYVRIEFATGTVA